MTDDDPITRADLERELHYMQTQVEQHGFPGTRAVLAELDRLSKENARLIRERERLREAEAHLWALVVWFGGEHVHPYINRDVAAAASYVNRHLSNSDEMTARHRAIIARLDVTPDSPPTDNA